MKYLKRQFKRCIAVCFASWAVSWTPPEDQRTLKAFLLLFDAAVYATLGATQSLGESGYHRFPNGLIFQWGRNYGTSDRAITLPMAFPNAAYAKGASVEYETFSGSQTFAATIDAPTATGTITVRIREILNGGIVRQSGNIVISWYAIGR